MKKKIIKLILTFIISLILILSFKVLVINKYSIKVKRYYLTLKDHQKYIQDKTIVYLSDLNLSKNNLLQLEILKNKLVNLKPDLIIFGGNLIHKDLDTNEISKLKLFLNNLSVSYGKYALISNQDHKQLETIKNIYRSTNTKIIESSITINFNENKLNLISDQNAVLDNKNTNIFIGNLKLPNNKFDYQFSNIDDLFIELSNNQYNSKGLNPHKNIFNILNVPEINVYYFTKNEG